MAWAHKAHKGSPTFCTINRGLERVCGVPSNVFRFRKYVVFLAYRLLFTHRLKLLEVFMTVVMYRSQQHGR